jgi:membrane protein YdbS with pleckstrin-like domain
VATTPGWYPDPWRLAALRWWDGAQWTPHVPPVQSPFDLGFASDILAAHESEDRMSKWARATIFLFGAFLVLQTISGLVSANTFSHILNDYGSGTTTTTTGFDPISLLATLVELAMIPMIVLFLIWQYNAAKMARGLGYPSRISPGLGVGSWFIPIVGLWFPHWALSDCLPPGHPLRKKALWAWWAYVLNNIPLIASFLVTAFVSVAVGVVLVLVSVGMLFIAIKFGLECFNAVQEDHRQRIQGSMRPPSAPSAWGLY